MRETKTERRKTAGTVQVLLGAPDPRMARRIQVFSRGRDDEWTLHIEGRTTTNSAPVEGGERVDLEGLISGLSPLDTTTYYRARAETGIDLGTSFRTLQRVWCGPGEALGEVSLPEASGGSDIDIHPLLLDGCFQVVGAARGLGGTQGQTTYLPFAWERFWLTGKLPERSVLPRAHESGGAGGGVERSAGGPERRAQHL